MLPDPLREPATLSRRGLLRGTSALAAGALAAPVLAGCAQRPAAGSGAPVRVKLTQAVNSLAFAQNYIAKTKGFYAEQGLIVETIVTDGGGPDVQAVLAGTAQFTMNDGCQVLTALKQNRRLVAVSATFGKCLINATISTRTARRLGVTDGQPVEQRIAALRGLRIGVTAPGALTWQVARFNLKNAGLDPDKDVRIVALGGGPAILGALENDRVDVIYISVPFGEQAIARGSGVTLIDNSAGQDPSLPSFMMEGLWAAPETVEEQPDTVRGMVTALNKANDFIANQSVLEIVNALKTDFPTFTQDVMNAAVAKLRSALPTDSRWDSQAVEVTRSILDRNGLLPAGVSTDAVFDDRFL